MPDNDLILSEPDRKKLDGIVSEMEANKESEDTIRLVVDDFKQKYGTTPEPMPTLSELDTGIEAPAEVTPVEQVDPLAPVQEPMVTDVQAPDLARAGEQQAQIQQIQEEMPDYGQLQYKSDIAPYLSAAKDETNLRIDDPGNPEVNQSISESANLVASLLEDQQRLNDQQYFEGLSDQDKALEMHRLKSKEDSLSRHLLKISNARKESGNPYLGMTANQKQRFVARENLFQKYDNEQKQILDELGYDKQQGLPKLTLEEQKATKEVMMDFDKYLQDMQTKDYEKFVASIGKSKKELLREYLNEQVYPKLRNDIKSVDAKTFWGLYDSGAGRFKDIGDLGEGTPRSGVDVKDVQNSLKASIALMIAVQYDQNPTEYFTELGKKRSATEKFVSGSLMGAGGALIPEKAQEVAEGLPEGVIGGLIQVGSLVTGSDKTISGYYVDTAFNDVTNIANNYAQALNEAGIEVPKDVEKLSKQARSAKWRQSLALTGEMIPEFILVAELTAGLGSIVEGTKLGQNMVNYMSKVKRLNNITKNRSTKLLTNSILKGVDYTKRGAQYELVGHLFEDAKKEATFGSGVAGKAGEDIGVFISRVISKMPGFKALDNPAAEQVIRFFTRGTGEVFEESAQSLYQIYEKGGNWGDVKKQFTGDNLVDFLALTYLMGTAMGSSSVVFEQNKGAEMLQYVQDQKELLTPEQVQMLENATGENEIREVVEDTLITKEQAKEREEFVPGETVELEVESKEQKDAVKTGEEIKEEGEREELAEGEEERVRVRDAEKDGVETEPGEEIIEQTETAIEAEPEERVTEEFQRELTPEQKQETEVSGLVTQFNDLSKRDRKGEKGTDLRNQIKLKAQEYGMDVSQLDAESNISVEREGKGIKTYQTETPTTIDPEFRSTKDREFTPEHDRVLDVFKKNIKSLKSTGLQMSDSELEGIEKDIEAGKQTRRHSQLLDHIESIIDKGGIDFSYQWALGQYERTFVPLEDFYSEWESIDEKAINDEVQRLIDTGEESYQAINEYGDITLENIESVKELFTPEEYEVIKAELENESKSQISEPAEGIEVTGTVEVETPTTKVTSEKEVEPIYRNEAIFSGKEKQRQQTIVPELSEEGRVYEEVSGELLRNETTRILQENSIEDVKRVAFDTKNDMNPSLRQEVIKEIAKSQKLKGDDWKKTFDKLGQIGTEAGQVMSFRREFEADPVITTMKVVRDRSQKQDAFFEAPTDTGTIGKDVDSAYKEIQDIAEKAGVTVTESDTVNSVIDKIVKKTIADTPSKGKARIKKAKQDRKDLFSNWKKNRGKAMQASIIPGLAAEDFEYIPKIIKTYVEEGVGSVEEIISRINADMKDNLDVQLTEEDVNKIKDLYSNVVAEETIDSKKEVVKDVIKQHYSKQKQFQADLTEKLSNIAGISEKDASRISKAVEKEFNRVAKAEAEKVLTKTYGSVKLPKKVSTKDSVDQLLEAINLGGMNNEFYRGLIADKFGVKVLTQADVDLLDKYSTDIQTLPPGELRNRKIRDLQTELDNIRDINRYEALGNLFLEIFYTSTLSGPTTVSRALKGGLITSTFDVVNTAITNPVASRGALSAMIRGFSRFGTKSWWSILKDGYSDVEFFEVKPSGKSKIDQIVNSTFKNLASEKKFGQMASKLWFHLPVKTFRLLVANDALIKAGLTEFHSYIDAYNQELLSGNKNKFEREFWTNLNKKLALDKTSQNQAEVQAEQEIEELKESGEKIPVGYKSRRKQEIMNEIRDRNYTENTKKSIDRANQALLMNDPVGTLGMFYRGIQNIIEVKKDDTRAQVIGKLGLRMLGFPFLRVATNFANAAIDYAPGLSAIRVLKRTTSGVVERTGTRDLSPQEKLEGMLKMSIGTTMSILLAYTLFEDDEEKGLVLKDDSWLQVTANGPGTYQEGISVSPDYKKFSFRFQNPVTGEMSDWYSYLDNPLGMVLAPHGILSDEIRFKQFKKKAREKEEDIEKLSRWSVMNPMYMTAFMGSQTYSQGLNDITTLVSGSRSGNFSATKTNETVSGVLGRPAKGMVLPNLYKQMYTQMKAYSDKPQKYTVSGYERLVKDLPLMEDVISGVEYDIFGYPIVRDFEIPLIPDVALDQMKTNRRYREGTPEWQVVYEFPEVNMGSQIRPPKFNKKEGRPMTNEEMSEYMKVYGDIYREEFNKQIEKLRRRDKYNALEVQKVVNSVKRSTHEKAKRQFFGK